MRSNIYSLKVKGVFLKPFPMQNDEVTIYEIERLAKDKEPNFINQNLKHVEVWQIGTFDDIIGKFKNVKKELKGWKK